MSVIQRLIQRAQQRPRRVVLPEGSDGRIVQAACRLAAEGIARPVVLGPEDQIESLAGGMSIADVTVVDPARPDLLDRFATEYAARREGVTPRLALRLVKKPLFFAAMMVQLDEADAMVAGVSRPTAQVIAAAALTLGYAEGISGASSFFLMVLPGEDERILVYADAAVAVDPSPVELGEIAVLTARNARALLGVEPRVALLSFSTHGSASHPRVDKVRQAVEHARRLAPKLIVDGELQGDAALSPRVAAQKCADAALQGDANILVFPDLDAGNIAYKLTQYLAGAQAIGPVMQGFKLPVNDLSRGASVEDIVATAAIAALQVDGH